MSGLTKSTLPKKYSAVLPSYLRRLASSSRDGLQRLTHHGRGRRVLIVLVAVAALVSAASTINSYGSSSRVLPNGPLAGLATPDLGAHEVDPQYSDACVTHDQYYPVGMLVDQSGWPLSFEYDYFTAHHDCHGMFYPILFVLDVADFGIIYGVLAITIGVVVRRRLLIRRVTLVVAAVIAAATLVTCLTAKVAHIEPAAPTLPLLSADSTDAPPFPIDLCSTFSTEVNRACTLGGPGLCEGVNLALISPSGTQTFTYGWPLPYDYSWSSACSGESFYPLIFLADVVCFSVILGAATWGTGKLVRTWHSKV